MFSGLSTIAIFFIAILLGLTILGIVVAVLPTGTLPSGTANTITWITQTLVNFDFIFPVDKMLTILNYVIIIEVVLFSFRALLWITGKVKGSTKSTS